MTWVLERLDARGLDPLAWFRAAAGPDRFFWSRGGVAIATSGALHAIETSGPERFVRASAETKRTSRAIAGEVGDLPLFVGGFSFANGPTPEWNGFPALRFVLPATAVVRRAGETLLYGIAGLVAGCSEAATRAALRARLAAERTRIAPPVRPDTDAEPGRVVVELDGSDAAFGVRVAAARDAVAAGAAEKLVVARSVRVACSRPIDTGALLAMLGRAHPACALFAVARGSATFLGASPERLARVTGRAIETAALAGTAPRGRNPEEDARFGAALRESKKEQEEHAVVVRAIRSALEPLCETLSVPEAPRLLRLDGIQHLETPIEGRLRDARSALDVAHALHPTPAVAGAPRVAACAWLAEHEPLARGWYAGGVGWLAANGDGDLAVALRCARIEAGEATLHAGAGIIAASDPAAESAETRIKLRALLVPLLEQ